MPADVETMMYTGQVPWHGLGKKLDNLATSAEAIVAADLDWEVETAPIVTADQKRTSVDDWRVTRRLTDNAILGVVKKSFKPIQNREAFNLFDSIVGAGAAVYETAGSLRGGSRVFILSRLPGVIEVGKGVGPIDEIVRYLLLSNAHDGSRPLVGLFTPVRVVCSNTLDMALKVSSGDDVTKFAPRFSIRHSSKSELKMKESARMMKAALNYYEKFGDFANFLYKKQVNTVQVRNIISEVFPPNKKREVTPTILGHRSVVESLFTSGQGHDKIAGSAYALWNAFTQYADHGLAAKAASKAEEPSEKAYSIWMGGAKGLKQKATNVIAEVVA